MPILLLIERQASESRSEIVAFLSILTRDSSGGRLENFDFDLWESRRFQGREFVRIACAASTAQHILTQAMAGTGIARDLLQGDRINGKPVAWLIHRGKKVSCDPFDIERICDKCRRNAAANALSNLTPRGGAAGQTNVAPVQVM